MTPSNTEEKEQERYQDLLAVERLKKGEKQALDELVRRYQDRLYRLAFHLLQDQEEALDVVQDAFLRVYQGIQKFAGRSAFYTWLYRITVNLAQDARRRKSRRSVEISWDEIQKEEEERGDAPLDLADEHTPTPRESNQRRELYAKVREAIDSLPPKHRTVLLLREVEDLSYEEIAEATGVSIGTVMSRLHHGRKKVQKLLAPYLEDENMNKKEETSDEPDRG